MNGLARIFAAGVVLGLAGLSAAENPPADSTTRPTTRISLQQLNHLQSQLKGISTVEADFVEEKTLSMLNHTLTIRGHFAMQKPDRLIWIVREPVRYAIRIEGDEIEQWDEDTNRVDVIRAGADPTFKTISDQVQAWFVGDYKALSKYYEVDVLGENPLSLRFVPRPDTMMGKLMSRIDILFARDERYVDKMVLNEAGGDVTVLTFVHTRLNQPIDDEIWRMPPNER